MKVYAFVAYGYMVFTLNGGSMREPTMLAAAALAVAIVTAAYVAYPGVLDRQLNEFRIDLTDWSCSTTTNGRVLSCVRDDSL